MTQTKLVFTGDIAIGRNQEKIGRALENLNRAIDDAHLLVELGKEPRIAITLRCLPSSFGYKQRRVFFEKERCTLYLDRCVDFELAHAAKTTHELNTLLADAIEDALNQAVGYFKKRSIPIREPDLALMREITRIQE